MKANFYKEKKEPFLLNTSNPKESEAYPNLRRRLKILEFHLNQGGTSWETINEEECRSTIVKKAEKAEFASNEAGKVAEMVLQAIGEGGSEAEWE